MTMEGRMPKVRYVKDIREGEQVRDLFLVAAKALLSSNAGKPYLSLSLRDRTGQLEGRVWDRATPPSWLSWSTPGCVKWRSKWPRPAPMC